MNSPISAGQPAFRRWLYVHKYGSHKDQHDDACMEAAYMAGWVAALYPHGYQEPKEFPPETKKTPA